ncbi:hypothetical protein C8F04DRAFT_1289338 [Mycena alexandri]|uniref:DUF6535 domain-containing protein n=1 Tax=Mycena alexandri TaxID=1745969 RepID=A0AAD6SKF8_9AGAR|nr:hypothetical protein C8F04DRAFT_1289338 [Mycena alexandri]
MSGSRLFGMSQVTRACHEPTIIMPDSEKSRASEQAPGADSSEEAADSPMWALYVLEAEKYDKSLVESWKSDMEGILIFAGLFSASQQLLFISKSAQR